MMKINLDKMRTPQFIFIVYVLIFSLLIMIFRFIFPGSEAPLRIYSINWRLIQGLQGIFNLFPALAFSALVIPFGFISFDESYQSFSELFFKRLLSFVITAIIASVVYCVIFFFAFPVIKNHEENLRFSGALYQLARKNMQDSMDAGEWFEASQYLGISERIWKDNPDLAAIKEEISLNLGGRITESFDDREIVVVPLYEDQRPVDVTQAIEMGRTAFADERYFDAHWLANLGVRLAARGSVQAAHAAQLASEAWNMIAAIAPSQTERDIFDLYNLKLSGFQAMGIYDWIRAFYIFQELLIHTPNDPDVLNYFAVSEVNAKRTAFFIDEMELSIGDILNGAVFSLPAANGRAVLRFSNLTLSRDIAYGFGFDYIDFDANMNLRSNGTSRYVKITPFELNRKPQVLIITHALDRSDRNNSYQSEWLFGSEPPGGILLDISYEEFLLISKVRHGLPNLQISELFAAANSLEKAGYVNQIFQAEILNRFASALFFLPMAVFIIVIAWRYRSVKRPRYFFFLLLPVLPVVFYYFNFMYRSVLNTIGIWLVISIGFVPALVVCFFTLVAALLISLIVLSAQRN